MIPRGPKVVTLPSSHRPPPPPFRSNPALESRFRGRFLAVRSFSANFGQKRPKSTPKSTPLEAVAPGAWRSGGGGPWLEVRSQAQRLLRGSATFPRSAPLPAVAALENSLRREARISVPRSLINTDQRFPAIAFLMLSAPMVKGAGYMLFLYRSEGIPQGLSLENFNLDLQISPQK